MDDVGQRIDQAFGLQGSIVDVIGIGQGQTRRYSVVSRGRRFIAKHYGPHSAHELHWVRFECSMLERLRDAGLPVAAACKTVDGQAFALVDNRPFLLFEWLEGSVEWPTGAENAASLGRALAEMHSVSDSLVLAGNERQYDIDRLIDRPLRLLMSFAEPSSEEFAQLESAVEPLRSTIGAVPINSATFGPVHGDIHQGNCVFAEDGSLAVFDFALCGIGYRTYDLTGFLWPMRDATIEDSAMRICCQAFLEGYQTVRRLTHEEWEAIQAFVHIRTLWETGDWIDTGTGRDQPDQVRSAIGHMARQFKGVR